MFRKALLVIAGLVALAGCLPIELEVGSDGRVLIAREEGFFTLDSKTGKATSLYAPKNADPVFGRFLPDGSLLAVTTDDVKEGLGNGFKFELVTPGKGDIKALGHFTNVTYLLVSPDGKRASYTRLADQAKPPMKENLPEVGVLDLTGGAKPDLGGVGPVAAIHRWFPDSQNLLVFQITAKIENSDYYQGMLAKVDVTTGKATPLTHAIGSSRVFIDLSPDGKKALFIAAAAYAMNVELEFKPDNAKESLYELDLATGKSRMVLEGVKYAIYSKTGKRVMMAVKEGEAMALKVADAKLENVQLIADNLAESTGGRGNGTSIYPGWIGNDQIVFLASKTVYGKEGKNLSLILTSADGKQSKNYQAVVDMAADAAGGK